MNIEGITSIFKEVTSEVPYSSAASMFNLAGRDYPLRFGRNCIFQSKELRERLESSGYNNLHFLRDSLHNHHCVLLVAQGTNYYLDPYMMAKNLINLDKILQSSKREMTFESYPSIEEETSHLQITFPYENRIFRILKTWPKSSRIDEFEFNIDCKNDNIPLREEYASLMFNPSRTSLSIRVLDINSKRTDHLMYPIQKDGPVLEQMVYIKTNEGEVIPFQDTERFLPMLDLFTKRLKTNREELLAFMVTAAELYQKFCPNE